MKAFVDSREPQNVKDLATDDYGYVVEELPQGDFYLPEHDVVVERKDASDFASSTTDGRLSKQADRMVAEHDHVFLVIENDISIEGRNPVKPDSLYNLSYSNIGANSITGMQTSLAVKRGVKIIYTESVDQTLYAVNRVFERFMEDEHVEADEGYVRTADTGEVDDVQAAMLAQIEGISVERAREILDQISFSAIAKNAPEVGYEGPKIVREELKSVDGVGDVLAERVVQAFQ